MMVTEFQDKQCTVDLSVCYTVHCAHVHSHHQLHKKAALMRRENYTYLWA